MAIQMRRGAYNKFDPTKLVAGEYAVVQSGDEQAKDGKAVYMAFAAGDVKRLATYEDMVDDCKQAIIDDTAEIAADLTKQVTATDTAVKTAESERVTEFAKLKKESQTATSAATTAATAAEKVNATLDGTKLTVTSRDGSTATVDTKGAKGDKGDKGDTGAKGADGAGARWNLFTHTADLYDDGTWKNLSQWTRTTDTYQGLAVASRKGAWYGLGKAGTFAAGTYAMSCYAKADQSATLYCLTGSGTSSTTRAQFDLTTEWQRVSCAFTATEDFTSPRFECPSDTPTIYLAGLKLEQGSAATEWRPAYADLTSATEAEYDRQVQRGTYAGRSIMGILGCSTWADTYAALHAKVSAADFSGLRVGDYMDVTFTGTDLITTATQRFVLAHFDPYLNTGSTALTSHHVAFVAQKAVTVASGVTGYVNSGRIQWNTTATNNGTAAQPAPYLASNLHAFEVALAAELPDSISSYVISRTARLETRYSSAGTLTDSNGYNPVAIGKLWSMSEVEYTGLCSWGTRGWSAATDRHLDLSRAAMPSTLNDGFWLRTPVSGSGANVIALGTDNRTASFAANGVYLMPRPCFLFA